MTSVVFCHGILVILLVHAVFLGARHLLFTGMLPSGIDQSYTLRVLVPITLIVLVLLVFCKEHLWFLYFSVCSLVIS